MLKTSHIYHLLTAFIFVSMGAYFWIINPGLLENKGINPAWFGGILLTWGVFRGINGFLMMRRKRTNENEN
jgi:hypothetical protein